MTTSALSYKNNLSKFQSVIALLVLCIVLSFLTDKFFTAANGVNVLQQGAQGFSRENRRTGEDYA